MIDRQALVERQFSGREDILPATSLVPPEIWPDGRYLFDQVGLSFDPAAYRSRAYDVDRYSPLELLTPEAGSAQAEFLGAGWEENLGIAVDIVMIADEEEYFEILSRCQYPLFLLGWYADYDSPYNFLGDAIFDMADWTKWSNAEYDRLVESARDEPDAERQMELYLQAERILTETDVVIVPIYHYYYNP